jgi:hypothetical protein
LPTSRRRPLPRTEGRTPPWQGPAAHPTSWAERRASPALCHDSHPARTRSDTAAVHLRASYTLQSANRSPETPVVHERRQVGVCHLDSSPVVGNAARGRLNFAATALLERSRHADPPAPPA